jgi:hypothetical protein
VKNINYPLEDKEWELLKSLATERSLRGKRASITSLIREAIADKRPDFELELGALKGAVQ